MDSRDIIIKPVLTEKSYDDITIKKYTFIVDKRANKTEIKKAVEDVFRRQGEKGQHASPDRQAEKTGVSHRQTARNEESICHADKRFKDNRILRFTGAVV